MGFQNHIAKSVGGAGEYENISRCIRGSEFVSGEVAGEESIRELALKVLSVGPISDESEAERRSLGLLEQSVGFCEEIEVLFFRDSPDKQENTLPWRSTALNPKCLVSPLWGEEIEIKSAGQYVKVRSRDAA